MRRIIVVLVALVNIVSLSAGDKKPKQNKLSSKEMSLKIETLNNQLHQKDSLLKKEKTQIESLKKELAACKEKLAVYEFFNNDSYTIFKDNSLETNKKALRLTGRNKEMYKTIRAVAEVVELLDEVEAKITNQEKRQTEQRWSDSDLKKAIALEIKADMSGIASKLDEIDKMDLSFLSQEQLGYYRKLSQHFDEIFNKYL